MESYSEVRTILKALCAAKGTSGNEKDAADAAAKMLEKYMPVRRNTLGSVCGSIGSSGTRILLDAHIDQIGLIVTAIDDEGFLKVTKCGGVDIRMLAAAEVTVHGKKDIHGVIISTPPHLSSAADKGKARSLEETAVDIGLSKEEAEKIVSVGDRITFDGKFLELIGNRISSPSVDDRAGVAAILRCLQLLEGKEYSCRIDVLFAVQEEVGGGGAATGTFEASPEQAIAVDVSFASAPDVSGEKYASLGKGTMVGYAPVLDYEMSTRLVQIAKEKNIDFQTEVMGSRTSTDCDEIQISGAGVRTALLSVPIRNMHTAVEVCDLADIEATARLMAEYIIAEGGKANA